MQLWKDSLFNKWCGENSTATYKRKKHDHYLTLYTKITQNRDLNITPETMKLLEENIGGKFLDIGLGYNFFNLTSKEKATKAKVSETTSNLKASAQQRKTSTKWKGNLLNGRKYLYII